MDVLFSFFIEGIEPKAGALRKHAGGMFSATGAAAAARSGFAKQKHVDSLMGQATGFAKQKHVDSLTGQATGFAKQKHVDSLTGKR